MLRTITGYTLLGVGGLVMIFSTWALPLWGFLLFMGWWALKG